jgi:hypothetical protein
VSALVAIREDVTFTAASADPDTTPAIDALTGTSTARTFTPTTAASTSSTGVTATPTTSMGRGFTGGGFGATAAKAPTALTPGVALNPASAVTLGGRTSSTSLNYPFQIIAWSEDNGAPKVTAPLDEDEPTAIRRPGQMSTSTTPSKNK